MSMQAADAEELKESRDLIKRRWSQDEILEEKRLRMFYTVRYFGRARRLFKTEDVAYRRLDTEDFVNIQGGVCWCICLSTSSCIESCNRLERSGHIIRENQEICRL
ncbi:hypothetical protein HanHA300_Chr14g0511201 [Helianthus annuus]|nr:hypothetical protein HanHA300_Chr14g0511201 [Helianthus annuus]KAJ0484447.1 hypothetical protein HanHA89_Chr14g0544201 [Helianthus annuus]KAJ0655000.1 hypothetical protein HanLR1_Chr14g0513471 [Helianthus annuus]